MHMMRIAARLGSAEITPATASILSTATTGLVVRLATVGRRQEFFPAVLAAKVEGFSIAFGAESGGFVHGQSSDGVFEPSPVEWFEC